MHSRTANVVLEESFLSVRAKLLEVGAALDRVDRALETGSPLDEDVSIRRDKIDDAIRLLLSERPDRAECIQLLFSRRYSPGWRVDMAIDS
ncbi:hypothetical protein [Novipirellula artificiosorum]|uniref:Uncharacterized protein n=1 Tax=Novipirellula artificiosorum TaxID=2528016 RepID=A0A5C6DPJ9_9BACT|nr:hypothetical protein [Novipirellula artificiosorum]TWU39223.1 hypothetical protein Poly41_20450 [Novipirellula artificiosorum]